jgi:SRSO17 transposase
VTDDPELSAAELSPTDEKRWAVELFFKDSKQLLGLGHYQNRSSRAAVTHLHLVCFAYALLTHLRMMRYGAQGQQTQKKAAGMSTAAAQDTLRALVWDDLVIHLGDQHHGEEAIRELQRLRAA